MHAVSTLRSIAKGLKIQLANTLTSALKNEIKSAFMTIKDNRGDTTIVNCEVTGDSNRSGVDFGFDCDNGESFTIVTDSADGGLLGYCDNAQEIELLLLLD